MSTRIVLALLTLSSPCSPQNSTDAVGDLIARLPTALREYKVIVEPDKNEPEWWAGAPSVVRDRTGTFWLACRMRTADAPRGLRGYEIRILRSDDGVHFMKVLSVRREDVPIPGFERPVD